MADLSEKEAAVSHAIGMIRAKVPYFPEIPDLSPSFHFLPLFRWELCLGPDSAGCWVESHPTATGRLCGFSVWCHPKLRSELLREVPDGDALPAPPNF